MREINSINEVIDGVDINYTKIGSGKKPLIMFIGYGMSSNFWPKSFLAGLAKHHTLYIINYPGVYSSYTGDMLTFVQIVTLIKDLVSAHEVEKPVVLGWSMGGGIAITMALEYPDYVDKLVLISAVMPTVYPKVEQEHSSTDIPTGGDKPRSRSLDDILHRTFNYNFYNYESSDLQKYKDNIFGIEQGIFSDKNTNKRMIASVMHWVRNRDGFEKFFTSQVPAIFLVPEFENVINKANLLLYISRYPNHELVIVPESGHAPFYQQSDFMLEQINNFLGYK